MNRKILLVSAVLPVLGAFLALAGCQAKSCDQKWESKVVFKNVTNSQVTLDYSYLAEDGAEWRQRSDVIPAQSTSEEIYLDSYSYQKKPTYHGKIDFDPKDAQCSDLEVGTPHLKLSDPEGSGIRLCHTVLAHISEISTVYIEDRTKPCPEGTFSYLEDEDLPRQPSIEEEN